MSATAKRVATSSTPACQPWAPAAMPTQPSGLCGARPRPHPCTLLISYTRGGVTVPLTGQASKCTSLGGGAADGLGSAGVLRRPRWPCGQTPVSPKRGTRRARGDRWTQGSDKVGTGTRWAGEGQGGHRDKVGTGGTGADRAWLTRGLSRCLEGPRPTDAKCHRSLSSEDQRHPDGCRTAHCQKPWPGPRGCVWQKMPSQVLTQN